MTALVVYESMFGSTKLLAEAIADALAETLEVRLVEVGALAAEPRGAVVPDEVSLLVVGAPTHAFGMSRAGTRADATKELGPVISATIGVREWLENLTVPPRIPFAAFDTKVSRPALPGSAAKAIDRQLRHLGALPLTASRTFRVHGKADGLVDGARVDARTWGGELAALLARGH